MTIKYAEKVESTTLLGPGNRAVIWVHGCCFNCPGCIAHNFKFGNYKEISSEELAEWVIRTDMNGLTISGGEPMLQADELSKMICIIRKKRDIGVIVYTGFTYEKLLEKSAKEKGIHDILEEIDILIDGPYVEELDDNTAYRGSSNQRILQLTERYNAVADEYYSKEGRNIEIRIEDDKTLMIGIPSKEQAKIWNSIKTELK